jgi:hypothetical protein
MSLPLGLGGSVPHDCHREVRFCEKWVRVRVLLGHRQRGHHESIGTTDARQLALACGVLSRGVGKTLAQVSDR